MSTKAVITGDIINSTRIDIADREELLKSVDEFLKKSDKKFRTKSETFRGDSFQCLTQDPSIALRLALIQKTYIRSFDKNKKYDARIAVGIGGISLISNKFTISSGKAFELSGQLLDKMKGRKQSLAISTDDAYNDELQTSAILLDAIISKTTALQCEVIHHKLLDETEVQIAKQLNIDQSAVNHRSNSGNWNAIDAMLKRFEKIYANEK